MLAPGWLIKYEWVRMKVLQYCGILAINWDENLTVPVVTLLIINNLSKLSFVELNRTDKISDTSTNMYVQCLVTNLSL